MTENFLDVSGRWDNPSDSYFPINIVELHVKTWRSAQRKAKALLLSICKEHNIVINDPNYDIWWDCGDATHNPGYMTYLVRVAIVWSGKK